MEAASPGFATRKSSRASFLCIGYVLFLSLTIKGLDQVRPLADNKKAALNVYVVFEDPNHIAKFAS
jgi:hypothetical protein